MFSKFINPIPSRLPTRGLLLFIIGLTLVSSVASPAVAQSSNQTQTATETDTPSRAIVYQFDDGEELVDVRFDNGTVYATVRATERSGPSTFSIAEAGLEDSGSFSFQSVRVMPGERVTVELNGLDSNEITVTTSNDGYYYHGDVSPPVVGRPTSELMQLSAVSGVIGSSIALGIIIGLLKRRHSNNYKELFSDRRHKIERDPVEGVWEFVGRELKNARESKIILSGLGLTGTYVILVGLGRVSSPGEIWAGMPDGQRVILVGSVAASLLALGPMYLLAKRLWDPAREFVLDLDARDVYRSSDGDSSGSVAAYSAPPERVNDLDVEGSPTSIGTPGGRCHLVRDFDPEENTAEASPPELADDREVSIEAAKIDHNREILTDLATIGRDLIGAMSAFRVTADSAAMKDIDAGLRTTLSAGQDSLEDVLADAVAGTRYEGTYQPDNDTQESPDTDDEEQTTNDDSEPELEADDEDEADGGGAE
jgi:hypothetical protein